MVESEWILKSFVKSPRKLVIKLKHNVVQLFLPVGKFSSAKCSNNFSETGKLVESERIPKSLVKGFRELVIIKA